MESRLVALKEQQGVIEEANELGIVDKLVEEIIDAYSKNPDVKSLPK